MRSRLSILLALSVTAVTLTGCGGGSNVPANGANNAAPANANTSNPLETKTPAPEQTTNDAPTLKPVFKAYCDAKIKGDEAALRKVYSAKTIANFEQQMKDDKVKTLVKFLETDKVTAKLCEIRNEQINGERAIAEITVESYPKGIKVVFVKENGEWKLTNEAPTFESMKANRAMANAAK
jgi:hypothetical protein